MIPTRLLILVTSLGVKVEGDGEGMKKKRQIKTPGTKEAYKWQISI